MDFSKTAVVPHIIKCINKVCVSFFLTVIFEKLSKVYLLYELCNSSYLISING